MVRLFRICQPVRGKADLFQPGEPRDAVQFRLQTGDAALAGVFVAKFAGGVRVAITGASEEGVFRWSEAEEALSGNFSAEAVSGLSLDADGMMADLHGSAEYRARLAKVMTGRAVTAAG